MNRQAQTKIDGPQRVEQVARAYFNGLKAFITSKFKGQ